MYRSSKEAESIRWTTGDKQFIPSMVRKPLVSLWFSLCLVGQAELSFAFSRFHFLSTSLVNNRIIEYEMDILFSTKYLPWHTVFMDTPRASWTFPLG